MRLPNGYGSCVDLGKNRRNRYGARVTIGWEDDRQIYKYIGYYPTKHECLVALAAYNENPFLKEDLTFKQVYDLWSMRKYEVSTSGTISMYKRAYDLSKELHDIPLKDIRLIKLQQIVDRYNSVYMQRRLKLLYGELWKFAVVNQVIPKDLNVIDSLKLMTAPKPEKHFRFTDEEMKLLWDNSDDEEIQMILILIYTGARPSEIFNLKREDFHGDYIEIIKGKTLNAARIIPLHDSIQGFFKKFYDEGNEYVITDRATGRNFTGSHYTVFSTRIFPRKIDEIGIFENEKGKVHTPYDTRCTFTSMWMATTVNGAHLSEPMRRKIQGHSGKGVGETNYTFFTKDELLNEINKLPTF